MSYVSKREKCNFDHGRASVSELCEQEVKMSIFERKRKTFQENVIREKLILFISF